jgi:hypothetical protein
VAFGVFSVRSIQLLLPRAGAASSALTLTTRIHFTDSNSFIYMV